MIAATPDQFKALRKRVKDLDAEIAHAIGADSTETVSPFENRVQQECLSHLFEVAAILHTYWRVTSGKGQNPL